VSRQSGSLKHTGVAFVGKVKDVTAVSLGGQEPEGLNDIANVDSVDAELLVPQELHTLSELLVDGATDDTGGNSLGVSRSVDNGGADNDVVKSVSGLDGFLGLD